MPSTERVVAAVAVLIVVLGLILAMLIINAEVGLWEQGSRLDIRPVGEVGSAVTPQLGGR